MIANGRTIDSPASIQSFISQRRSYLLGLITANVSANFSIRLNNGADFSTNRNLIAAHRHRAHRRPNRHHQRDRFPGLLDLRDQLDRAGGPRRRKQCAHRSSLDAKAIRSAARPRRST